MYTYDYILRTYTTRKNASSLLPEDNVEHRSILRTSTFPPFRTRSRMRHAPRTRFPIGSHRSVNHFFEHSNVLDMPSLSVTRCVENATRDYVVSNRKILSNCTCYWNIYNTTRVCLWGSTLASTVVVVCPSTVQGPQACWPAVHELMFLGKSCEWMVSSYHNCGNRRHNIMISDTQSLLLW